MEESLDPSLACRRNTRGITAYSARDYTTGYANTSQCMRYLVTEEWVRYHETCDYVAMAAELCARDRNYSKGARKKKASSWR